MPHWDFKGPIHPVVYRQRLPWTLQKVVYRKAFQPLLEKLDRGDLVYVHNRPQYAAVLATLAKQHGIQVVLHMHNSHLIRSNKGQLNALRKTPVVFCSEFVRREANTALPNHFKSTWVVYNGADGTQFYPVARGEKSIPTVVFTGRLQPYKGVHILMEAMRILQGNGIEAKCKIVGASGFGLSKATRYTRKLKHIRPENTELVGYKSGESLAELVRNADIFCSPSIFNDPFPLAPLEAMAAGLPVVASNVGGLPEALAYGGGVLVPPDAPKALASALERLVTDNSYREELGQQARASYNDHFQWSSVRDQYDRVIQRIAS
jgi:spore coat protein SA